MEMSRWRRTSDLGTREDCSREFRGIHGGWDREDRCLRYVTFSSDS